MEAEPHTNDTRFVRHVQLIAGIINEREVGIELNHVSGELYASYQKKIKYNGEQYDEANSTNS